MTQQRGMKVKRRERDGVMIRVLSAGSSSSFFHDAAVFLLHSFIHTAAAPVQR